MKKSNIILSAIGLISIIGGVLAFKAQQRFAGSLLCYTTVGTAVAGGRTYKAVFARYIEDAASVTLLCTVAGQMLHISR